MELAKRLGATFLAGVYAVSPIDLIPDFLLGIGQMDDLAMMLIVIGYWFHYVLMRRHV